MDDQQVTALRWAIRAMPPPPEVQAAGKAHRDLWQRVKSEPYRELTRDEQRLDRRYLAIHDAYVERVLEAYRHHS